MTTNHLKTDVGPTPEMSYAYIKYTPHEAISNKIVVWWIS
jgi:hypothetical protein